MALNGLFRLFEVPASTRMLWMLVGGSEILAPPHPKKIRFYNTLRFGDFFIRRNSFECGELRGVL